MNCSIADKIRIVTHAVVLLEESLGFQIPTDRVIEMLSAPHSEDHISIEMQTAELAEITDLREKYQVEIRFSGVFFRFYSTGPAMAGGIPMMRMADETIKLIVTGALMYRDR